MDHLLPILSEEEYNAEVELLGKAIDPDEVDNVVKRWLRLYLPTLKPGEFTQEALDIIECRITYTEKITKLSRRYRKLMEDQKTISLNNVLSEASTNQLNAGPSTSSSSVTAPTAHSTGTPTFNPPRPAASSTTIQIPNLPPTDDCEYTVIGPNGTTVSTRVFQGIPFKMPNAATRRLLCLVFTEEVLAKNTLTDKPSPALQGRERSPKGQLDPDKVSDVIHCITSRTIFNEKEVRTVITAKCSESSRKKNKLKRKLE